MPASANSACTPFEFILGVLIMTRTEVEEQLIKEIHEFPIELMEAMLNLVLSVKHKTVEEPENKAGLALREFLKKYEQNLDTFIFDSYRKNIHERDIEL